MIFLNRKFRAAFSVKRVHVSELNFILIINEINTAKAVDSCDNVATNGFGKRMKTLSQSSKAQTRNLLASVTGMALSTAACAQEAPKTLPMGDALKTTTTSVPENGTTPTIFETAARRNNAESLNNPEVVEKVMKESGFKVESTGFGRIIFQPKGDGTYDITARLVPTVPKTESCDQKTHPTGKYVAFTMCGFESWKAPAGFEQTLAEGKMDFDIYWSAVSKGNEVPAIGGGETSSPIMPQIYQSSFNGEIQATEAEVWRVCWDTTEGKLSQTIKTEISKRTDCRDIKGKRDRILLEAKLVKAKAYEAKQEKLLEEALGLR